MLERAALIQLLLIRLERISADSPLAHRASGVRGTLLRLLDRDQEGPESDPVAADQAIAAALSILRKAAAELRGGRQLQA